MALRADDGTVLYAKDPEVIDKDGTSILKSEDASESQFERTPHVKVFKLNPWFSPLLVLGIMAAVSFGVFIIGAILAVVLILGLIRWFFRVFKA